ncbi:MAG TPA: hypothetical protein VFI66_06660 [Gemmatimonadales bacterium]|nr:hypothetical protein [Gemmatimonadales bacterium]
MRPVRVVRTWLGIVALAGGVGACETARNPGGVQRDVIPPSIALSASADTQQISTGLSFNVTASDNLGLKDIRLTYTGGYIAQTDTIFNSAVTTINLNQLVTFGVNSGAGGFITIIGRATDGAGNFAEDTIVIFLNNVQALKVALFAPAVGALASSGKRITVAVSAAQAGGIQRVGFIVVPRSAVVDSTPLPINTADSVVYTTGFPDSIVYTDTLTVLATTGTFSVTGFAVDLGGRRAVSTTVVVTVQSAANDVTPPVVSHTIAARIEVSDSITVHATDPSGISLIGFQVDTSLTLTGPPLALVTVNVSAGNLTDVTRTMSLGLASLITTFPKSVIVRGYACDLATPTSNCGYSQTSTLITAPRRLSASPIRTATPSSGIDTVVVVAGITRTFPLGGKIADAIFNANQNELYLTNPPLHRVEIFQVANTTFVANPIVFGVGVPWGVALWPRDTLGNYGDSIVVADAGGTQLAIVDVRPAVRQLQWRQDLPNFLIETYKILTNAGGGHIEEIIVHDVSDRPQYVATVCRVTSGSNTCHADSIFAVYSTTPTASSTSPFSGKATLRMEKLVNTSSPGALFGHLFWELGATTANETTDTLRIEEVRGVTSSVVLSACAGITVKLDAFGLGDSTYARNSGNFTHAFVGEGGNITTAFARVMAYDSRRALTRTVDNSCVGLGFHTALAGGEDDVDFGMSPGVNVSDFISNTGIKVASIATNFNGRTNVVRADSIYYLDEFLRLKATSCALAADGTTCVIGAPGMDMNYFHDFSPGGSCTPNCGGGTSPDNRLLFAARPDGNIDVFDTFDGSHLLDATGAPVSIPLRDPIIGPLRVARDASGQLLFGITAKGLVMVRLPAFTNPNPVAPLR